MNNSLSINPSTNNLNIIPVGNDGVHSSDIELPSEILNLVFKSLIAGDLGRCSRVCRKWNVLAVNDTLLKEIISLVTLNRPEELRNVFSGLKAAIVAHKRLTSLGSSTFDNMFELAKSASKLGLELVKAGKLDKYSLENGIQHHFWGLGSQFVKDKQISKAEEALALMSPGATRGIVASQIMNWCINENDLPRALKVMVFLEDNPHEGTPTFCSLFLSALKANKIEIALEIIEKYKYFHTWAACVKDLSDYYLEKGLINEYTDIQTLYPQAFQDDKLWYKLANYYAYTERLEKAEQLAFSKNYDRATNDGLYDSILTRRSAETIQAVYSKLNKFEEAERVKQKLNEWYKI